MGPVTSQGPRGQQVRAQKRVASDLSLTLTITPGGSPPGGRFFEDIGFFAMRGQVSSASSGQAVALYWYNHGLRRWIQSATMLTDSGGRYALNKPVGGVGRLAFRTTLGGAPGSPGAVASGQVTVTVVDATIAFRRPAAAIDSLSTPPLPGAVSPARAGVRVLLQVRRSGAFVTAATTTTTASGAFTTPFRSGVGSLATYDTRFAYKAANRNRWEVSVGRRIVRAKVLAARVTRTTAAEVAKTYRGGCPVGPSKLRTIRMNFLGYDNMMHRGVLIVRSTLVAQTIRGFDKALRAGFPLAKMDNPNVYGGNDPKQMAANNTSGFNCRKVVGNPYRMSPHSWGIAIDVNTVQNPYRDRTGKWWPTKGKKYIDRTPLRKGMLFTGSALTRQLQKDRFFWGGRWSPGRDYQHFERR